MCHLRTLYVAACGFSWTRWFDTDDPNRSSDDESLERIQSLQPEEMCPTTPLVIEVRQVGKNGLIDR